MRFSLENKNEQNFEKNVCKLVQFMIKSFLFTTSRSGGIGRRAGLKILCRQLRAGSSPAFGTKKKPCKHTSYGVFSCSKFFNITHFVTHFILRQRRIIFRPRLL